VEPGEVYAPRLPNALELQELYQRRHRSDRNHHHRTQLNRHAVFEVFQIAGKVRTDLFDLDIKLFNLATQRDVKLFDLVAQCDLEFFYISLDVGNVSLDVGNVAFRGQVLFDEFRLGIGQRFGLLLGEPGFLEAFGELEGIEGS
jgi:hypothetical protein